MRYIILIILVIFSYTGFSQATDLIISEYVEGSANNKYIEIYNGTAATITLTDYQLRLYANGASIPTTSVTLTGTIASGATIVYKNSAATIYGGTAITNTALNFNGDDAIALFKISSGSFVDIFGNIGCDPGTGWTSGVFSTLDKTLVRNTSVCAGITIDDVALCPFSTLATEWTQSNIDIVSGLGSHTMTCVACAPGSAPTTNASLFNAITFCTSAQLSFTAGNGVQRLVVVSTTNFASIPSNGTAYTANATFGSGATVGAGNFVVLNGAGSFVNVTGLANGTTYFVKIFEYSGATPNCNESYLTAGVSSFSFTTQSNCTTPQIRSILVDACSSNEGVDELVIIENGVNPLPISDLTIAFPSGGTYCNSGCGTNTFLNNPAYFTQLNTLAGCTLFQYADPIPANAIIVVFTGLTPSYVFDYSTQCPSSSTYYAVFCNNASTAGRFANSGVGTRTLDITFGLNSDQVTYNLANTLGDGTFVDFDNPGNPTYRQELNCIYPLSVEWGYFSGKQKTEGITLNWQTLSENNADYFSIEHADLTGSFSEIGTTACTGNSMNPLNYEFTDRHPATGMNYYRLNQYDFDGASNYSSILAFQVESTSFYASYLAASEQLVFSNELKEGSKIVLYQTNGQVVREVTISKEQTSVMFPISAGIWMIQIEESNGDIHFCRLMVTN